MKNERDESEWAVTLAERAGWVRRYRESGVGLKEFAERNGLRSQQLHYWTYGSRRSKGGETRVGSEAAVVFREYRVAGEAPSRWEAEVACPDGTTLRLGRGAEPTWVGALVEQLRRPCSH
ncbi:MAG: hypothetical protein AB7O52_20200 [Planctomycetota bacterium]